MVTRSNDAYDGKHVNTDEFNNMVQAVTNAQAILANKDVTNQAAIAAMENINRMAQTYLTLKHKQIRPIQSSMRKARLQYAENLVKYATESARQLRDSVPALRGGAEVAAFVQAGQVFDPEAKADKLEQVVGKIKEGIEKQQKPDENAHKKENVREVRSPVLGAH